MKATHATAVRQQLYALCTSQIVLTAILAINYAPAAAVLTLLLLPLTLAGVGLHQRRVA